IEQAIGQWALFQRATRGWSSLSELLEKTPIEQAKTELPAPKGFAEANNVSVLAPGEQVPALRNINFKVQPGQALGVIGPSGAGKTTLAKVLTGIWQPAAGKVRLDGAALDQWPTDNLGRFVGYLPQEIGLLAGTVADNIARMDPQPDPKQIVLAAQRAGAHELLLSLPQGYDTDIGAGGQRLSGGQRQRVALARALYEDPPLLILDEPNANLDAKGEQALVDAIREAKARGRTVIIMAHRPSAIAACDLLLMIDKGQQVDFGPRDDVLKKRTRNYPQLVNNPAGAQGGQQAAAPPQVAQAQPSGQPIAAQAAAAGQQMARPTVQQTTHAAKPAAKPAAAAAATGAPRTGGTQPAARPAVAQKKDSAPDAPAPKASAAAPRAGGTLAPTPATAAKSEDKA
ncbi:MAG: ATP-binding cassette domain-containing protein, partial [Pseudomonadota bacterium]